MIGSEAREYFLGKKGMPLGCAQAVAQAAKETFSLDEDFIQSMKNAHRGKAPLGHCGAIYAAVEILRRKYPQQAQEVQQIFHSQAGSLLCREIRQSRTLSCSACVQCAGDLLFQKIKA